MTTTRPIPWRTAGSTLGLLIVTFACDGDPAVQQAEPSGSPAVIQVTLELTVGGAEGPGEYVFHSIGDILPAADGSVWVVDGDIWSGTPSIRRYDSSGRFLGHVGQFGDGPGEYREPSALAELPDGRVVVRDMRARHMPVYRPDGRHDTTWTFDPPLPQPTPVQAATGLVVDHRGIVWAGIADPATGRSGPAILQPRSEEEWYVRLGSNGSVVDTVVVPLPERASEPFTVRTEGTVRRLSVPYRPRSFLVLGPDGRFATGATGEYSISLLAPPTPGATFEEWESQGSVGAIVREREAVPVGTRQREAARARLAEQVATHGVSAAIPEIPTVKPPIGGVWFDEDGRLWVRVSMPYREGADGEPTGPADDAVPEPPWYEPQAYDVFARDGSLLGRIVLPRAACREGGFKARVDVLWCRSRGLHEVETLEKYRIHWP